MVGSHSMCMINFPLRASPIDTELLKKMVYENTRNYINQRAQGKESNQYWIVPDAKGIAVSSMSCRQFMRQGNLLHSLVSKGRSDWSIFHLRKIALSLFIF